MRKATHNILLTACVLAFVLSSGCGGHARSSQPDAATQSCFDTVLAATTADDYDQFASVAAPSFRKALTPAAFHSVSQSLAARMQGGCAPTYLGQLRQNGAQVFLWRLTFADGSDDLLARMGMSQDRVSGFLITPAL